MIAVAVFFCTATPVFCGQLSPWNYTNSLNYPRDGNRAVIVNDTVIYTFGEDEFSNDTPLPVERATILPNGSLSPWTVESERYSDVRDDAVGAYANGFLYVIGGINYDYGFVTTIQRATVNLNGTLGTWTTIGSIPTGEFTESSLIQYNQYIYVIAGYQEAANPLPYIYRTTTNPDGTLGSWILCTSQLATGRYDQASILINTTLYVMCGFNGSGIVKSVERACLYPDGELSAFSTLNSTETEHGDNTVVYDGQYINYIDEANGVIANDPNYYSERAQVYPDGSLGSWEYVPSQRFNVPRGDPGFVTTSFAAYAIGGVDEDGIDLASVEFALLIPTGIVKREWEIFD